MAENKKMYTRQELLDQICECGQSIIDNAESILGDERYFNYLEVSFQLFRSNSQYPTIQIARNFTPELQIENLKTYYELKHKKEENIYNDDACSKIIEEIEHNHIPNIY